MKRKIIWFSQGSAIMSPDELADCLNKGYVLDPVLGGRPIVLEQVVVFPLVLYESEDEKPKPEAKLGEFDDVASIRSVDIAEADALIAEGYALLAHYAKTATLIKRRVVSA